MPRAALALSVLILSQCIELKDHVVAGRMIDTKKSHVHYLLNLLISCQ